MARSPFGSPEEKRRSPEETRPPVEAKPLEKTGEDKAESFEDCRTEQKAVQQPEQQELEQAREEFDECAEREQKTGEQVEAQDPENFDEDEYEECGGHYVAHVEYRVTDPEQGAISQAEGDAAYQACEDPEDMQELSDNLEARGGVEVESAEVVERPDPEVELHGTEAEKEEFIEAHREADEAAEKLEEAEQEAAEAQEAAEQTEEAEETAEEPEEVPEQPEEVSENTEETPEEGEDTGETTEQTEETEENTEETAEETEETTEETEETEETAEEDAEKSAEETAEQTEDAPEDTEEKSAEQAEETSEQAEESPENTEESAEQTEETAENTEESPEKSGEDGEVTEDASEQPEEAAEESPEEQAAENPEESGEASPEGEAAEAPEESSEEEPETSPEEEARETPEEEPEQSPEESPEEEEPSPEEETEESPEEQAETAPEEQAEENPEQKPEESSPEEKTEETPEGEEETSLEEKGEETSGEETENLPEEKAEENPEEGTAEEKTRELPDEDAEETAEKDPEADAQARENGEVPLTPEQAEAERVDIEKNAGKDGELRPDSDTFRRLSIQEHACREQMESTRQQLEEARRQAADSFANMPPFGTPEYKDALKAYNEARDRQEQLEETLSQGKEQLEELESTRRTLYQQAYEGRQKRMNEIDQLQIRASEQQDRAEAQIYAEHPDKEEMSRIADSNTRLIERLAGAEAGLDAMIAARQAELAQYAAHNNLGRWESEHDPRYLQMVKEQQEWIQKKSELSYLRAKAEEDNRQMAELQQQTKKGFFGSLADKLRGRTGSAEAKNAESPRDTEGDEGKEGDEYAELRRLGVEKIDLDECREEYRPQVIEAVQNMLEKNPELVGQVKEIRCWKMRDDGTFACYGPSEMDEPFGGVLQLNATKFSSPGLSGELETAGKNGWFVPESNVRSIITHEMGHAVHLELCAIQNGIEHGQVPDPDAYCRMWEAYKENYHADTIVEQACQSYGIEFDSEAFADNLSAYGGKDYGEALAEAEAEAQNSSHPRPMALRIHAALQTYKQNLMERAARRKAESQTTAGPEQPVTQGPAKQAAAPENDFIRRLRKDAPTPEQQAEAVRRWQQRRKMETASDEDSDIMHGDGGARTRDTKWETER